jgi:hypothetical protein
LKPLEQGISPERHLESNLGQLADELLKINFDGRAIRKILSTSIISLILYDTVSKPIDFNLPPQSTKPEYLTPSGEAAPGKSFR